MKRSIVPMIMVLGFLFIPNLTAAEEERPTRQKAFKAVELSPGSGNWRFTLRSEKEPEFEYVEGRSADIKVWPTEVRRIETEEGVDLKKWFFGHQDSDIALEIWNNSIDKRVIRSTDFRLVKEPLQFDLLKVSHRELTAEDDGRVLKVKEEKKIKPALVGTIMTLSFLAIWLLLVLLLENARVQVIFVSIVTYCMLALFPKVSGLNFEWILILLGCIAAILILSYFVVWPYVSKIWVRGDLLKKEILEYIMLTVPNSVCIALIIAVSLGLSHGLLVAILGGIVFTVGFRRCLREEREQDELRKRRKEKEK